MTAITIVRGSDAIAIASDGAAYEDDGTLRQIVSKVELMPNLSCVIGGTGSQLASKYFRDLLFWLPIPPVDFDGVIDIAPTLCEQVYGYVQEYGAPSTRKFTLFFCGWSESRGRLETYAIKSREWENVPNLEGEIGTAPPFTLVPLPEIHCAPAPEPTIAEQFGITVPGQNMVERPENGIEYAMRAVVSCRFCLGGMDMKEALEDPYCCVGGFLQITTVTRDAIVSQIVHRWPDVIGERMDVMRGGPNDYYPLWMRPPEPIAETETPAPSSPEAC